MTIIKKEKVIIVPEPKEIPTPEIKPKEDRRKGDRRNGIRR